MISFLHLTYTYPGAELPILQDISLEIPSGAFVLVTGPSGAGKSTFLRCINGLVPHFSGGRVEGQVRVDGLDPLRASPQEISRRVGFVFQDPEAQFVMNRVEDEIAFALENAAVPPQEMHLRVEEVLSLLNLAPLRARSLESLSGGEQQRVATAAALSLRPSILVLDEPTSQLDPQSADEVLQALERLQRQLGLTVVLAEHRLERVLPFCDRLAHVENRSIMLGAPREVLPHISLAPPLVVLGKKLGWNPLPLTLSEARNFLSTSTPPARTDKPAPVLEPDRAQTVVLRAEGLGFFYGKTPILRGVDFSLNAGEVTALMGKNGAGKSTLLRCLVGLLRPSAGNVFLEDKNTRNLDPAEICFSIGYLPQDPNALLYADTVRQELEITLYNHHLPVEEQAVFTFLDRLGLADYVSRYPRDLSVGERQRVSLGAVTVTRPPVILLDEPTRGLDYRSKGILLNIIRDWRQEGTCILLVTHDVEFAAEACDRVIILEGGRISTMGKPSVVFRQQELFRPQIVSLFPETDWVTPENVVAVNDKLCF